MLGERSSYEAVPKEHWPFMKIQPVNFATRAQRHVRLFQTSPGERIPVHKQGIRQTYYGITDGSISRKHTGQGIHII
jgi:hypothetical protein